MTPRERVFATLRHESPDKVPYEIAFTQEARRKMIAYYGDPHFEKNLGNVMVHLSPTVPGDTKRVGDDVYEDQFGVHWDRSVDKDIGVVTNRLVTPETLDDFTFPDPDDSARYADFDEKRATKPDHFAVAGIGFSLFERAWTLTGMEPLLMAMVTDPDFVHRLLDRIADWNIRIVENACRHDIDAFYFGDDWGQQTGLIMGPDLWREFILPRLRRMYGAVKAHGKFVTIHSCGKVQEIFPDLIAAGLDLFNPFQPEVMDPVEMKEQFGDRLAFHGGISTQKTLPFGTPEETREEVKRLLEVVGENGGYIAAPAHDTPADAKPENVAAMIEVLQNQ